MIPKNDNEEPIRVIIADDHVLYRAGVKTALSAKKDIKVIAEADNGMHLLNMLKNVTTDVILLDIQMPVMDGILATKKIREIESSTNKHTPIIAITANALAGDKENCLAAGMNDYISKPFQPEVLIQKIKNLLTSSKS